MSALKLAGACLLSLFRREALDRKFDQEAQSHLDLAVEDYVRRGMPAAEARRLIFREGLRPVALGLIVGLTVSLAVNRILQSQLVGVSPYDPVTLATAPAVLILVALLACHIPSRRALRIDPVVALRHD